MKACAQVSIFHSSVPLPAAAECNEWDDQLDLIEFGTWIVSEKTLRWEALLSLLL